MTDRVTRVLAIPGSLRRQSYNRSLVEAAVSLAPPAMSITVYESLDLVPVFNEDVENPPPDGVARLREAVASSDGLLIATPEYNQSLPGVVKNVIDWLSRSDGPDGLTGKPVAVSGVTTGPWGTRLAQTQLRQVLTSTQALVLSRPTLFLRDATTLFDEGRNIVHKSTSRQLREFLVSFDRWIRLVSPHPCGPKERES
ncbi:MAG TPA: NAD(P)H-dependent oxidoreductase [Jiangellaceae bacterium]|nr:NAD(P)H-dependent oxidoreductase [Jiangellaceae bacterium]